MPTNIKNSLFNSLSRVFLIVLLIVSIAMTIIYLREDADGPLHKLQNSFHSLIVPVEFIGSGIGVAIDNAGIAISDATADESTLQELKERNQELTQLLTQSEEYRLENERLQELLNLKETYAIEGISGRVIGRSFDSWNQTITIDVGSDEGVESGLTVMGPQGVIGQVISSTPGSSSIRLLSDPNSGAACLIQSSRADGIVRGSLSGALHLENVSNDVEVNIGDVILTSGLGGSYVKGLLVGTVAKIDGNAKDGTRVITVVPNEHATALEEVIVIFSSSESSNTITDHSDRNDTEENVLQDTDE